MSNMMSGFRAYIGTYTNGGSRGIYTFTSDSKTGKIEDLKLAGVMENPTYLCLSRDNRYLYSVAKVGEAGGTAAFSVNPTNGELELLNYQVSPGKPPCHVSLDNNGKHLLAAFYHRGNFEVLPLESDGSLKPPSSTIFHEGSGPNKSRQDKPYVHFASLTPDEKFLCAVDLGTDKIEVYRFNNGELSKHTSIGFRPGSGPRHMAFHPNGRYAYVITELSSEVVVLKYGLEPGSFEIIQYISALPGDFNGESLGAAIHLSPDGSYLFASNRGHDSIALFKVDSEGGTLCLVSHTGTGGSGPRDFTLDPTGSFLYAANQNTNNIVAFSFNRETGELTPTGQEISVPSPVCIKFENQQ